MDNGVMGRCLLIVVPGVALALAVVVCQTGQLEVKHLDRSNLGSLHLPESDAILPLTYSWPVHQTTPQAKKRTPTKVDLKRVREERVQSGMRLLPLYSELEPWDKYLEDLKGAKRKDLRMDQRPTVKLLPYSPKPGDRRGMTLIVGR